MLMGKIASIVKISLLEEKFHAREHEHEKLIKSLVKRIETLDYEKRRTKMVRNEEDNSKDGGENDKGEEEGEEDEANKSGEDEDEEVGDDNKAEGAQDGNDEDDDGKDDTEGEDGDDARDGDCNSNLPSYYSSNAEVDDQGKDADMDKGDADETEA